MTSTTATARTPDGIDLLTRHWPAVRSPGSPRAEILIVHGVGEHSGRYEHVGDALAAAGFDVHSYDQRGFGSSGGRRAWVDTWNTAHADLEARVAELRSAADGRPIVLYGHSLGSLIALGYALSERPRPDLLVLSAPGLDDRLAGWRKALATVLDRLLPDLALDAGIRRPMLAAQPRPGFLYEEDPLVETKVTVHFGALGLAEQARVRHLIERLDHLPVPTLAVHGADDPLVPVSASARLQRFPEVTGIVYPGLRHETHNEASSRTVADVVAWLDVRLPMLESSHN
jgi:alpha-beta hydrolase superfamily lysophospholipase